MPNDIQLFDTFHYPIPASDPNFPRLPDDLLLFGAQYYRYPTPRPTEWDKDMARMAQAGFNAIKIWAQWRSNNPAEDKFDFNDIVRLLDCAQKHGLRVVINVIFDVAPAWFYRKYPDSMMITGTGRTVYPCTAPSRQTGEQPGPCYHHEAGRRTKLRFLSELVGAVGKHPALLI